MTGNARSSILVTFVFGTWQLGIARVNNTSTTLLCGHDGQSQKFREFSSPGSFDERRLSAGWPPTLRPSQSTWAVSTPVGCCLPLHHRRLLITPKNWYLYYRLNECGRLSRPRHCSKGAQPVPKAVYRSGYHDKHDRYRRDSIVCSTPQSDAPTTRLQSPVLFLPLVLAMGMCLCLSVCPSVCHKSEFY